MSDFLLSELLVLSLLLPVLLRPFVKPLKKGQALPILPFISIFVCICILFGQGIILSFCVLCCFAVIVACSEIMRAAAFFHGVFNDFYAVPAAVLRGFLLCLFCAAGWLVVYCSPEAPFIPEKPIVEQAIRLPQESGNPVEACLLIPANAAASKTLVVVAAAFPFSHTAGSIARIFADAGYSVLEITRLYKSPVVPRFNVYRSVVPLMLPPQQGHRVIPKETGTETAAFFDDFLLKAVDQYGQHKQVFLYTEGIFSDLAMQFCINNPGVFNGAFFNVSEEEPLPLMNDTRAVCTYSQEGGMPPAPKADTYQPFYFYIHPHRDLAGFGSLRADDILAALLLGSGRDLALQDQKATAEHVIQWLQSRMHAAPAVSAS
ncbi:MAG: hypothetical protein ACTTH8_05455 [Treponema sp.]